MKTNLKLIAIYTLLFGVLAAVVFYQFISSHTSFIQYGDSYRQGYFWLVESRNNLETLLSGGGLTNWSWSKGLGMETSFITDPFTVLAAAFPAAHLELGYTVAIVAELYFCGLTFIAFAREVGMKDFQCILGAICYAFCGWGVDAALLQYGFVLKLVLFPLLILSVDRVYKGKSPLLFILTVAYYTITGVYFAYMAAIGVIMYILVRYAYYNDEFKLGAYVLSLGKFILYGITGLAISTVTSLPYALSVLGSTTESASDGYGLLYSAGYYLGFGKYLLTQTVSEAFADSYSYLGLSAIALMAVPVAFRKFSLKSTPAIMTIICGIMFVFPFFSSAMNGFGYCSSRWFFMAAFFLLWAGVDAFELSKLAETKNTVLMIMALAVMFLWTIGLEQLGLVPETETDDKLFVMLNLFSGLAAVLVILAAGKKEKTGWKSICIVGICAFAAIGCWNIAFQDHTSNFLKDSGIYKELKTSTQRVSSQIKDDGFYRVDQVNGIHNNRMLSKPANENLWWKTRNLYIYDSKIPADMIRLNGLVGNNYGYAERVFMLSNDNRMGLDFLMGVKYFLGNDTVSQHFTPDNFAGYGFKKSEVIDGVTVWKNKYDAGLGFGYDACISETEFNKLSRLEREQALLQAAVLPDNTIKGNQLGRELKADDIETKISPVKFTMKPGENTTISSGMITAAAENATFTIVPKDVPAGQIIVSFDGFERMYDDGSGGNNLVLYVGDSKIEKSNWRKNNNQTLVGLNHYDINLGYREDYKDEITVRLAEAGQYKFDEIYLSSMSASLYEKYASERVKNRYNVTSFDNRQIKGTVDMQKDGILFFSMYDYDNWDIYVDGKKAKLISNVNIAFTGVELSHGQHDIMIKYNTGMLKLGLAVSLAGLLLMIVICVICKRRERCSK